MSFLTVALSWVMTAADVVAPSAIAAKGWPGRAWTG
jgi:hypothetical protein